MILRPVRPQSPSGPPITNFSVGLTCQTVCVLIQPTRRFTSQCRASIFSDWLMSSQVFASSQGLNLSGILSLLRVGQVVSLPGNRQLIDAGPRRRVDAGQEGYVICIADTK